MTLRASYAGITLLALLGSGVVASAEDDNKREPNIKTAEAIELFVSCESNYPLLSVKWDNGDIEKAAETASAFFGSSVRDTPSDHRQSQGVLFGAKR